MIAEQIAGRPIPDAEHFDLAAVEHALALLWQREDGEDRGHNAVRACSLNLAIPIIRGSYDNWQQATAELSGVMPSRILVLEVRERAGAPSVDAEVSATCHRRKGGLLVCSEVIRLLARPDSTHLLPSICRSLAVSDLPLCLLALEDAGLGPKTDQALIDLSQIVVTDSCSSRQPEIAAAAPGKATDLAWPRLSPWRAVMGNFLWTCSAFDAGTLSRVEVAGDPTAARLYAGWLAQLLGWRVNATPSGPVMFLRDADHPLDLHILSGADNVCGLTRVTLRLAGDDYVEIMPTAKTRFDVSACFGGHSIEAGTACHTLSFAEEVASIVHSHGMDRLYDQALTWATRHIGPRPAQA